MTVCLGDANRSSIDDLALQLKLKNDMGERLIDNEAEESSSRSEGGRKRRQRRIPQGNKAGEEDSELSSVTEGEGEGKGKPQSVRSPSARPRKSKQQGTPRSTAKAKV